MSQSVHQLLKTAADQGNLSRISSQLLANADLGQQIQQGMGSPIEAVTASEIVVVQQLIDDSGSIRFVAGNTEAVREGSNGAIEALQKTKQAQAGSIFAALRFLNDGVLYDIRPIAGAELLTTSNFNPDGGTPLYDQTIVLCGTAIAKAQEYQNNGIAVRTINLIVTDGHDQHSQHSIADCASVVQDLLKTEMHIVAAIGITDGTTDFQTIFRGMGIPDQWILTPQNRATEIRKAFALASQSAVRASQGSASFSQTAMGGFGK